MKNLFLVIFLFIAFEVNGQNDTWANSFLKRKWYLEEFFQDSISHNIKTNKSIYYIIFDKVKKNKNKYSGVAYFIRKPQIHDTITIYSYITRFELNLSDTSFQVKRVEHLSFNKNYTKDLIFLKFINYFLANKQKILDLNDTLIFTNDISQQIKLKPYDSNN